MGCENLATGVSIINTDTRAETLGGTVDTL